MGIEGRNQAPASVFSAVVFVVEGCFEACFAIMDGWGSESPKMEMRLSRVALRHLLSLFAAF